MVEIDAAASDTAEPTSSPIAPGTASQRAGARVLLFLPGLEATENQTAARVAQLLAQSASKTRPGTYLVETTPGGTTATVLSPERQPVLKVVQVEYLQALNQQGQQDVPGWKEVAISLYFAAMGTLRVISSVTGRQRSKSPRAKVQLLTAFAFVSVLWLSCLLLAVAVLASLMPDLLPTWLTRDTAVDQHTQTAGLLALGVYVFWRLRRLTLVAGARIRAVMRYMEQNDSLLDVTSAFDQALDDVLEANPAAEVHVFGFSFGSVVALDAFFPRADGVERRSLDRVSSLVTVGCPADLIRLLYPDHFERRSARRGDISWTNLFIPADVFGSNFLATGDDQDIATAPSNRSYAIGGVTPSTNIKVGRDRIRILKIPTMEGFTVHGQYWDRDQPRYLEHLTGTWLRAPVAPPSPGSARAEC
jgi:pimeloyl-ACP methyl ester carboxylesterase